MAVPIWQDYTINVPNIQSATFTIATGGVTIYSGKVFAKDNSGVNICINDICADYLMRAFPNRPIAYDSNGIPSVRFTTLIQPPTGLPSQDIVEFTPDWSYDRFRSASALLSSAPIRRKAQRGQLLFVSTYVTPHTSASDTITYVCHDSDGDHSYTRGIWTTSTWTGHFDSAFFTLNDACIEPGTFVFLLDKQRFANTRYITIQGMNIDIVDGVCCSFALHYINAYGGWDSLMLAAGTTTDNLTRKSASRLISNQYADTRESANFANTIKQKYTLYTGWLTNGDKMHHLLGSTCVYLQDIQSQQMIPVNIADTTCEYKDYKSNGGKMVSYTINCELAQGRKRL